jgi:hypothetical protein
MVYIERLTHALHTAIKRLMVMHGMCFITEDHDGVLSQVLGHSPRTNVCHAIGPTWTGPVENGITLGGMDNAHC